MGGRDVACVGMRYCYKSNYIWQYRGEWGRLVAVGGSSEGVGRVVRVVFEWRGLVLILIRC